MVNKIVMSRYGEAFISFAKDTIGLENALQDLKNLKLIVIDKNPEFMKLLCSLDITFDEKSAFIDSVLEKHFSEEVRQFLKLLIAKGHISELGDIMEYIRVTYANIGLVEAVLRTSFPLDIDLIKKISSKLEEKYKKKFKLFINLDATLLGGIQVIFGNKIIDGSVRKRLTDLKAKMLTVRV